MKKQFFIIALTCSMSLLQASSSHTKIIVGDKTYMLSLVEIDEFKPSTNVMAHSYPTQVHRSNNASSRFSLKNHFSSKKDSQLPPHANSSIVSLHTMPIITIIPFAAQNRVSPTSSEDVEKLA